VSVDDSVSVEDSFLESVMKMDIKENVLVSNSTPSTNFFHDTPTREEVEDEFLFRMALKKAMVNISDKAAVTPKQDIQRQETTRLYLSPALLKEVPCQARVVLNEVECRKVPHRSMTESPSLKETYIGSKVHVHVHVEEKVMSPEEKTLAPTIRPRGRMTPRTSEPSSQVSSRRCFSPVRSGLMTPKDAEILFRHTMRRHISPDKKTNKSQVEEQRGKEKEALNKVVTMSSPLRVRERKSEASPISASCEEVAAVRRNFQKARELLHKRAQADQVTAKKGMAAQPRRALGNISPNTGLQLVGSFPNKVEKSKLTRKNLLPTSSYLGFA